MATQDNLFISSLTDRTTGKSFTIVEAYDVIIGGGGGDDPSFTTLTEGQIPKANASQKLVYGGATVDPTTLEWTFDKSINVPSGSVNIGEVLQLSEGIADLVIVNHLANEMSFAVKSDFSEATGSSDPFYYDFGAAFILPIQTDDSEILTANPLTFSLTGTVVAPDVRLVDEVVLRTNGPMTNFRAKLTDTATGLAIRYIPSKSAYEGDSDGLTLGTGDITFHFAEVGANTLTNIYLGFTPFLFEAGQNVDLTMIADSIDLLGDISDEPYMTAEVHDGPPITLGQDTHSKQVQTTGLLQGGVISISSPGTVDWTSGKGQVVDYTDPENVIITDVEWDAVSNIIPAHIGTDGTTLFGYDSTGSIEQRLSTAVTIEDAHNIIWFGSATHLSSTLVSVITAPGNLGYDGIGSFTDFVNLIIGPANVDGNVYGPNGTNLNIDVVGGNAFMLASNFRNNTTVPDIVTLASDTALTFRKCYRSAGAGASIVYDGAATTTIDPTQYDDGSGTLQSVTAGYFTIQRIFRSRAGGTLVAYGQEEFASLALALEALGSESFVEKSPLPFTLFRSSLIVQESATDLSDTAEAEFFEQSSFRLSGAQSAASTIPGITTPGGVDTSIQYNDGGVFGGEINFAFDDTLKTVSLQAPAAGSATYDFVNSSSVSKAQVQYDESTDEFSVSTSGSDLIFKTTETVFNEASADIDFRVESNANTHAIFLNSLNGVVGINNDTPVNTFHIYDNNANEYGAVGLQLEQDGIGDSLLQFHLTGSQYYSLGIDNDDAEKFKLSRGIDLNSDTVFEINSSTGDAIFSESVTATNFLIGVDSVVVGPSSSTANSIAVFDDTNGQVIAERNTALIQVSGSNTLQTLQAAGAGGAANFFLKDSAGGTGAVFGYNSTSGTATIDALDGILELQGYGDIQMQIAQGGLLDLLITSTEDYDPAIRVDNSLAINGAVFDWYFSDRTPLGNISAPPGSLCFRNDGNSSDIYLHRGTATNNTDWVDIFATGSGDVVGPATSRQFAIPTYADTSGKVLLDNATTTLYTGLSEAVFKIDASGSNGDSYIRLGDFATTTLLELHVDDDSNAVAINTFSTATAFNISNLASGVDTDIAVTGNATIGLTATGANTNPPVRIGASGTDGALIQFFTSGVHPEGVITGNPGDLCIYKDGLDSRILQLESLSSGNTGWTSQEGGDVDGPASSTLHGIATYADTTGKVLNDNPRAVIHDDSSITEIILTSGDAVGDSRVRFRNYLTTDLLTVGIDDDSDTVAITASSSASSFDIVNNATDVDLGLVVTGNASVDIVASGANTNAPLRTASLGTNGAIIEWFMSDTAPEGVITGNPGDICIYQNGVASRIYQLEAASSGNTGWVSQEGGDVSGPATTVVNSIPTWGDTTGTTLQENDNARLNTTASATTIILDSPSATGTSAIAFKDSNDSTQVVLEYVESSDRTQLLDYSGSGVDIGSDVGLISCRSLSATDMFVDIESPTATSTGSGFRLKNSSDGTELSILYDEDDDETLISYQNPLRLITTDTTLNHVKLISPSASGFSIFQLLNSTETIGFSLKYAESTDTSTIQDGSGTGIDIVTAERVRIETSASHSNPILELQTTGATGGDIGIHVGNENPEGTVTGTPGSLYIREDGVDSTQYIHDAASSGTTGWKPQLKGPTAAVTANTMAYFSDTSGSNIVSAPGFIIYEAGSNTSLDIYPLAATGTSQVGCWDFAGSNGAFFNWVDNTDTGELDINNSGIHATSDPLNSTLAIASKAAGGAASLELKNSSSSTRLRFSYNEFFGSSQIVASDNLNFGLSENVTFTLASGKHVDITSAGPNTSSPFQLETYGTNGANSEFFLSDVTPISAITGTAGDVCFQADAGIGSNIYLHAGASSNNTAWHSVGFPEVRTSTATESIAINEDYIRIDATAATRVITLPDATSVPIGKDFKFKLVAKGTGFYGEITPFAGDTIDGSTSTRRLATVGDVFTLRKVSDTGWDIVQSARTAHAEMFMSGSNFTQGSISSAVAVTAWTDNGDDCQGIITSDQANNKFTIDHVEDTVNGDHYKITANLSYEYSSSSIMILSVYVGGVATGLETYTKGLGFSNDQLSSIVIGDFSTTSTGDVEVRVEALSGTDTAEWWAGHVDIIRH
ncbi:MAG: hypothetical protein GY714_01675 [Desulfobacterales bacterium]|nr:hypothetical protein [Desulfobacterales bacterium]